MKLGFVCLILGFVIMEEDGCVYCMYIQNSEGGDTKR